MITHLLIDLTRAQLLVLLEDFHLKRMLLTSGNIMTWRKANGL